LFLSLFDFVSISLCLLFCLSVVLFVSISFPLVVERTKRTNACADEDACAPEAPEQDKQDSHACQSVVLRPRSPAVCLNANVRCLCDTRGQGSKRMFSAR
jgi:hypothetical protein